MLRGNARVADVAESVLAFARGEEGVEAGGVGVLPGLSLGGDGWGTLLLLVLGRRGRDKRGGVIRDRVGPLQGRESGSGLLLGEGGEGGGFLGEGGLWLLGSVCCEGVVGPRWLGRDGGAGLLGRGPGVVGAGLRGRLVLDGWLLLLVLAVHLLRPWVVGVLGLDELLLRLLHLLETCLLGLVVTVARAVAVLEGLLAGGLAVGVVEVSSLLWLLLTDRITGPVHLRLLLVSLVETGRLRDLLRRGCAVEEQIPLVLVFERARPQFLLFFTQLDGFEKVVISLVGTQACSSGSAHGVRFGFVLRRFQRELVFQILLVAAFGFAAFSARRLRLRLRSRGLASLAAESAAEFFQAGHARLPRSSIRSFRAQPFLV